MSNLVVDSATLTCSNGTGTCSMSVSSGTVTGVGNNAATIMDNTTSNVSGFIMCTSMSNPAVSSASGVPQSCSPQLSAPWSPGKSQITISGNSALDSDSTLTCSYGGTISVTDAGESTITLN